MDFKTLRSTICHSAICFFFVTTPGEDFKDYMDRFDIVKSIDIIVKELFNIKLIGIFELVFWSHFNFIVIHILYLIIVICYI